MDNDEVVDPYKEDEDCIVLTAPDDKRRVLITRCQDKYDILILGQPHMRGLSRQDAEDVVRQLKSLLDLTF